MASNSQTSGSKGFLRRKTTKKTTLENSNVSFFTRQIWKTGYRHRTVMPPASTSPGGGVSTEPFREHRARFAYAPALTSTYATVRGITARVEGTGCGHFKGWAQKL